MTTISVTFLAFAIIHSITVSIWFKGLCQTILGETFMRVWYRFLYNVISVITAAVTFHLIWKVPDRVIWTAPLLLRGLMHGIQIAGIIFGALAFRYMDSREFMGFRQVWRYIVRREVAGNIEGLTESELVTTGVYGIVRHPMYCAGIVIVTFSPIITINGVALTILADLYFLFGVFIEERRFMKIFGDQYREYMQHVPRMIPRWRKGRG